MKKIAAERTVYKGKFLQLKEFDLENEDGASAGTYECLIRGAAACAMVYNPATDKFIFVRQYRPGADKEVLEVVAGMVDESDTSPEEAIVREIGEELGYSVREGSLKLICEFYSTPGACSEKMYLYSAVAGEKISNGGGIDDEEIDIIELSREEMSDISLFEDAKTLCGVLSFTK